MFVIIATIGAGKSAKGGKGGIFAIEGFFGTIAESKDFVDPKKLANLKEKYQLKEGGPQTRVKQDIFLGEIPLMTEEGTFVISGCERIVISQIIRSPGIYFRKEFGTSTTIYTATIISNKGLWTKFIYDTCQEECDDSTKSRMYIKLNDVKRKGKKKFCDDTNKLFLLDFMKYFGFNFEEIYDSSRYPLHLQKQELEGRSFEKDSEITNLITRLFLLYLLTEAISLIFSII
jgi:DNA-directed RNA polymerase beta subunit